jgi:hypothetical protein
VIDKDEWEYRGGGVSQGGLFELGEMAVSVRVFCAGGWKNSPFATLHG